MIRSKKRALTILPIQPKRPHNLGVHKTLGVQPEHLMGNGEKKTSSKADGYFWSLLFIFSSISLCCRGTVPALCEKTAHRLVCKPVEDLREILSRNYSDDRPTDWSTGSGRSDSETVWRLRGCLQRCSFFFSRQALRLTNHICDLWLSELLRLKKNKN